MKSCDDNQEKSMRLLALFLTSVLLAVPAFGQNRTASAPRTGPPAERVTISVNGAFQASTMAFTDSTTFPYNAETARLQGDYNVKAAPAFDAGGWFTFWRQLGAGVSVARASRSTTADLSGSYPHPFFFDQERRVSWSDLGMTLTETSINVSAVYSIPTRSRVDITVFGGPSFFQYKQGVVEEVRLSEAYPYDTLEATTVNGTISGSATGFHAGADVSWFLTKRVGFGGLVRFSSAKKTTEIGDGEPFDLTLGGLQAGGGLRLRF